MTKPNRIVAALLLSCLSVLPPVSAVEIIAHRGASADAPENTLPAMKLAWEQQADAIELDLWLSKDGKLVVFHDSETKRFDAQSRLVSSLTLEELRQLDVGAFKGPQFQGERIPSLESILATIPPGRRAVLELKCGPEILPELRRVLRESGRPAEEIAIISFDFDSVRESKRMFPDSEHYFLHSYKKDSDSNPDLGTLVRRCKEAGLDGLDLQYTWPITEAFVAQIKDAGLKLITWTVDDPEVAARHVKAGVDGITTNKPKWLRDQLKGLTAGGADLDQAIRQHRMGTLIIETAPNAVVRVEQVRHEFWFGAALANHIFSGGRWGSAADAARYKEVFLQNFNSAVTENALKWHDMERERGQVNYAVVDAILAWTKENDIPLRGHNIYWGIPNRVQPWQKTLDDSALRQVLRDRAFDIGRRYRGQFAEYDLNNEMLHANYYEERLGPGITREMAAWVKEADPDAVLYLNDYDILTGNRLDDYIAQIRRFLEQGVPVAGIGVQGHLHGDSFDPAALRNALDQLAQFKLPIKITEFNFPGQRSKYYGKRGAVLSPEEEEAKARNLAKYYRICFAHPAVDGILMWGFWEGANWIPVSSLYRRDWTPTPAAAAYRDLVFRQWWTRWEGRADAQGRCELRAFYGKHRVTAEGRTVLVDLQKREGRAAVSLR